jgi:DNA-binding IclR family transcriptional regulator
LARPAPSVTRALQIVDLLVSHPADRFTISDIARRTGMSLGSAHAVLATLEDAGYVSRHPLRKTYVLGPALVTAGVAALEQHPAIRAASDEIAKLAAELGADVVVTAPTPTDIIFIACAKTRSRYGPGFREGERVPLVPPLGAVFMAWAGPDEVEAWLARTPSPHAPDRARAERILSAVRARGFAVSLASSAQRALGDAVLALTTNPSQGSMRASVDELFGALAASDDYELTSIEAGRSYDVAMIAAPIFDADSRPLAAIAASGFPPGLATADISEIAERIVASAVLVTKQTRGRVPA